MKLHYSNPRKSDNMIQLVLLVCLCIMPQLDMIFNSSSGTSAQFRAIAFAMTSITTTSTIPVLMKKGPNGRNSHWRLSTTASPDIGEPGAKKSNMKSTTSLLRGGSTTEAEDVASPSSTTTDDNSSSTDEASTNLGNAGLSSDTSVSLPLTVPTLPTLRQYIQFALPCLALWIAGPLLSLVDTSFIGLSSQGGNSARQLAALGPATTL